MTLAPIEALVAPSRRSSSRHGAGDATLPAAPARMELIDALLLELHVLFTYFIHLDSQPAHLSSQLVLVLIQLKNFGRLLRGSAHALENIATARRAHITPANPCCSTRFGALSREGSISIARIPAHSTHVFRSGFTNVLVFQS